MKQKIYAKSIGNKNACMLIPADADIPSSHTDIKPLDPKGGFTVDWNASKSEWEYNAIPEPENELV